MLQLKNVLSDLGQKQTALAGLLGVSQAGVAQLLNHGIWPKTADKTEWRGKVGAWLIERGASAEEIRTAFNKVVEPRGNAAQPGDAQQSDMKEGNDIMVLRKQALSQPAKAHWCMFNNPFEKEVCSAEEVYLNVDLRYTREAMWQTARNGGFLAVIAESGAGKSTLRKDLIERVFSEREKVILIEPYVVAMEENDQKGKTLKASHIAEAIMSSVAPLSKRVNSPEARFKQLHDALKESASAGNRHCIVIEEAHSLSIPMLKHLKRFFELEFGFRKLVSIILIGQPELKAMLSERNAQVREVVQRCEVLEIPPLSGAQLAEYLAFKFKLVGKQLADIMDDAAVDSLRAKLIMPARNESEPGVSRAYPLAINNLVTVCLNEAAALGADRIDAALVREV